MVQHVLHPRTAVINQKQKNQSKIARYNALRWLAEKFPEAFDNTKQIRPLAIGIMHEILTYALDAQQLGISKNKLREAVLMFTRRIDYLSCLKTREMRINLQGQPIALVTEEEAESAGAKIKKRIEKTIKNQRVPINAPTNKNTVFKKKNTLHFEPQYTDINFTQTPKESPIVTIKQKITRSFDPVAVARLKEKLGLQTIE